MIHFLIKIKHDGELVDIIWSNPAYLFLASFDNLYHQIILEQWTQLEADINQTINEKNVTFSKTKYQLKKSQTNINLFLINFHNHVMVFGQELEEIFFQQNDLHQVIISRFLETIVKLDINQTQFSETSKTNYFEKIQALNNDLINTQRELLKANAQLSKLNKTLNNRLVKDPLTGLISRYQYEDELLLTINLAPKAYGVFAFIDLDDFKSINDTYGHKVGDEYLKAFADRLSFIDIKGLLKIRIAGDEFGLYAHGYNLSQIYEVIKKIESDVKQYITSNLVEIEKHMIQIKLSIGFAIYNLDSDNVYQLIEYADFAMYQAKKQGKGSNRIFNMDEYIELKAKLHE